MCIRDSPLDGHVQHHPLFRLEVPVLQLPQGLQLPGLQLRDEAQAPHVDAQHRNLVQGHQLGEMQDGAVPAEGNQQVGAQAQRDPVTHRRPGGAELRNHGIPVIGPPGFGGAELDGLHMVCEADLLEPQPDGDVYKRQMMIDEEAPSITTKLLFVPKSE